MDSEARNEEESRRLANLLAQLVRLSRRSVRSIEQEHGVGSSGLGKVLNGTVRLQTGHIFMILETLGMTPGQFFQLAYPRREKLHPLVEEMRKTQGLRDAEEPVAADFEAQVRNVFLRMLAEILRQQDPGSLESRPAPEPASEADDGLR